MSEPLSDDLPGLSAEDRAFLAEIRAFVERHWHAARRGAGAGGRYAWARPGSAPAVRAWFDALVARGWSVPEWPVEHGGTGWPLLRRHLWNRELALAETPAMDPVGVHWAGPALIAWGDPAQQAMFLPGIRAARERWCLGVTEPQAGSDLTRLEARARPVDPAGANGYVVEGLKSWVSGAQDARWMLTMVRTGADSLELEAALTLLIVDLGAPGVDIEPVRMLDGSVGVCRVRLDRVRVPAHQRLGAEGAGWRLYRSLAAQAGRRAEPAAALRLLANRLGAVAAELPGDDGPLAADPGFARKLAELGVDLAGLEALELRVVGGEAGGARSGREHAEGESPEGGSAEGGSAGREKPLWERSSDRDSGLADRDSGPEDRDLKIAPTVGNRDLDVVPAEALAAVLRLRRTGISQRIGELFVEAFGYYSLPYPDPLTIDNEGPIGHDYALAALQGMLAGRSESIDGGTSETLRDRIAHQLFGY